MLERREEQVWLEARHHEIVLARPLLRALVLVLVGLFGVLYGWPLSPLGALLLAGAAATALLAVWRWERTRLVVTSEKLALVHGTLRQRSSSVRLSRLDTFVLEQTLPGRVLGYGTLVAGELEIPYVPEPRRVYRLVERLSE
jgi:uncharacterized membrane protein YdbT with pleckstrin-like domain